jgi:hypothetical protein
MKIDTLELAHWFNAVRDLSDSERTRALDAFWDGQLDSKAWLVEQLADVYSCARSDVYIFGGWIGTLASMLWQESRLDINNIVSVDIDPWCEQIAKTVNGSHGERFHAVTADMSTYEYDWNIQPNVVINTSSEHVDQSTYDTWYDRIPPQSLVVVQGNDFFSCDEHVRCSRDLEEFEIQNHVVDPLFKGQLKTSMYTRFMCIWIK